MSEYQCELEVVLLSLRSHCTSVTGEAASILVQFVASLLLSSVQDCHNHEAEVERILAQRCDLDQDQSLCSPSCLTSLDEILAAPLEIPDLSLISMSEDDGNSKAW